MSVLVSALGRLARHGRIVLILGLVLGATLPEFAGLIRSWLPELVGLLLFVAALRIGPRQAFGVPADLRPVGAAIVVFQVLLPIAVICALRLAGMDGPLATALTLLTAASPISGSPNLTLLTGNDPAPSLRLLIFATALLPLTVIPVLWLTPALGSIGAVLAAAARLLVLIAGAAGLAFALRASILKAPRQDVLHAIDGASALLMGILVIGLMSAVGPALHHDQLALARNLAVAAFVNFGLQIVTALTLGGQRFDHMRAAFSIASGNRNIALFLAALPAGITGPLLLFIGCYQVPMYLTPLVLSGLYRRRHTAPRT